MFAELQLFVFAELQVKLSQKGLSYNNYYAVLKYYYTGVLVVYLLLFMSGLLLI